MSVNPQLIFGTPEQYEMIQGRLYILLSRAIQKAGDSGYQSPHWDHQPSKEEEEAEERYIEECEQAGREVEVCAKEIYKLLTGKQVQ